MKLNADNQITRYCRRAAKHLFATLLFFVCSNYAFAQGKQQSAGTEQTEEVTPIFTVVEEQPEFPGGEEARKAFFAQNLVKPDTKNQRKGWVTYSFIVNTDSSFQDITLLKGLGKEYDEEVLRVIKAMPKWTPGRQSGHKVRVRYILPIEFK